MSSLPHGLRPSPRIRAALRIARRDALRARGRSILVVAMLGLPVLALTTADVLARTAQLSPAEELSRELGAADASLFYSGSDPVEQDPSGHESAGGGASYDSSTGPPPQPSVQEVLAVLPVGSRLLPVSGGSVQIVTADGLALARLRGFDYADPAARGLVRQVSGRAPQTATEVALSRRLVAQLGLHVGDTMRTRPPGPTYTVVGIVENRYDLRDELAYVLPGAAPPPDEGSATEPTRYLVDAPESVTWADVRCLNALGFIVRSRSVVLHPPPRSEVPYYQHVDVPRGAPVQVVAAAVLAVGMALLEVVLLAGPAFAVGARRRRRDLALVAATGGERRDVRNVVLSGGGVLGAAAAVAGITLGIGLAAALQPLLERLGGSVLGHFDVRPLELATVAAVSVGTGLAAAVLPARSAARQDVVAALAGRRGQIVSRKRVPVAGLVIAVVGAVVAIVGAGSHGVAVILAGAVLGEIGLIMCAPALLGLVARLGPRLPLCPRLAVRDAARNRASVAPAVAAVMAAVAGSVAISVYVASLSKHDQLAYHPSLPQGNAVVQLVGRDARDHTDEIVAALQRTLPVRDVLVVRGLDERGASVGLSVEAVEAERCPLELSPAQTEADMRRYAEDPRCGRSPRLSGGALPSSILVDDGTVLPAVAGTPATEAVAALRAEKSVVFDSYLVADGHTTVRLVDFSKENDKGTAHVLPAVAVERDRFGFAPAQIVLSPAAAQQLGIAAVTVGVVADDVREPTEKEEQAARAAVALLGADSYLYVERGYQNRYDVGLLALVIGAGIITLGAAAIATALSNEDGRSDLSTLAAVGASPRVRRALSMSRSGVIAGLGTILGLVAGWVPAVGLILALRGADQTASAGYGGELVTRPLVIPWPSLAVTALVVPLIAVAVAGLVSRSRLPVERTAPR